MPGISYFVLLFSKGKIYSIQNKQILLEFSSPALGGEKLLAKLIPGQKFEQTSRSERNIFTTTLERFLLYLLSRIISNKKIVIRIFSSGDIRSKSCFLFFLRWLWEMSDPGIQSLSRRRPELAPALILAS